MLEDGTRLKPFDLRQWIFGDACAGQQPKEARYAGDSIKQASRGSGTDYTERHKSMCLAPNGRNCSAGVLACEFGRCLVAERANRARTPFQLAAETAALR